MRMRLVFEQSGVFLFDQGWLKLIPYHPALPGVQHYMRYGGGPDPDFRPVATRGRGWVSFIPPHRGEFGTRRELTGSS